MSNQSITVHFVLEGGAHNRSLGSVEVSEVPNVGEVIHLPSKLVSDPTVEYRVCSVKQPKSGRPTVFVMLNPREDADN